MKEAKQLRPRRYIREALVIDNDHESVAMKILKATPEDLIQRDYEIQWYIDGSGQTTRSLEDIKSLCSWMKTNFNLPRFTTDGHMWPLEKQLKELERHVEYAQQAKEHMLNLRTHGFELYQRVIERYVWMDSTTRVHAKIRLFVICKSDKKKSIWVKINNQNTKPPTMKLGAIS